MDRDRLAALYERFGPVVWRRARAILRDDEEARDVMQDVFLKATDAAPDGDDAALRWFYRVTTNHCIGLLRRRRVRVDAAARLPLPDGGGGEQAAVDRHTALALLERLDAQTQAIVVYHYLDGMTVNEVATMTSLSTKTIGRRLERFRTRARALLER